MYQEGRRGGEELAEGAGAKTVGRLYFYEKIIYFRTKEKEKQFSL